MTKNVLIFLFLVSNTCYGESWSCIPPMTEGYWSVDGPPDIVEMWLDSNGSSSAMYHEFDSNGEVISIVEVTGSWKCLNDEEIEVSFPKFVIQFVKGVTDYGSHTLTTQKHESELFSERVFDFTGY